MSNTCSICRKPEIEAINQRILLPFNFSLRNIAEQFGTSPQSLLRHIENCLKLSLSIVREKNLAKQGIEFDRQLEQMAARANKLLEACDRWLADPDNPELYSIEPRDKEIDVVYEDHSDLNERGKPKRKRGNLNELLLRAEKGKVSAVSVTVKGVDNRSLLIQTMSELGRQLRIFGDATGKFQQPRKNDEDVKRDADARVAVAVQIINELIRNERLTREQAIETYFGQIRPEAEYQPLRDVVAEKLKVELSSELVQ